MDGSGDVQMAEVPSSRSSSLSPPPSSLPDSFEYQHDQVTSTTATETTVHASNNKVLDTEISLDSITLATTVPDITAHASNHKAVDTEVSLDSITLSTPIPEEADDQDPTEMLTRAQKKAADEAAAATAAPHIQASNNSGGKKKSPPKKPTPKKPTPKKPTPKKPTPKKPTPTKPAPAPESSAEDAPLPAKKGTRATAKPKAGKKETPAKVPKTTPKAIAKPKAPLKKWLPENALTSSRSPLTLLGGSGLRALLCKPEAWDILNMQEKMDIIALMPQTIPALNSGSMTRPDTAFLASDDNFNADCGLYLRQLENGQHTKKWIRDAMAAHDRHRNGEFDEDIKKQFTEEWGETWPGEEEEEAEEVEEESEED